MNQPTALPPAISAAWSSNRESLQASGRSIDEAFVQRGFTATKALIDFKTNVYGPGTYDAFLEAQSSPEAFEIFRARDTASMERIKSARNSPLEDRLEVCNLILNDHQLTDYTKDNALAILCEAKREELFRKYVPSVQEAQISEQAALCTIYRDSISLLGKEAVPIRKEAYNATMADAFGSLGFVPASTKRGVNSFSKKLTKTFSIFIDADISTMERDHSRAGFSPLRYWPTVGFDGTSYLGSTSPRGKQRYITFLPVMNCVAASQLSGYDDTRSLEMMVRRQALWYELTAKSFERAVIDFG